MGKPTEVPPNTRRYEMEPTEVPEVHEATGTLHKVNDGHTTRPHSYLGGRYIDGKPQRGPARYTEVQEVHEATSTLHNGLRRPRQRSALPTALLYRKVYQVRKEFGPAGGVRDPESQESIAPNPNPNDFILEPRSGSPQTTTAHQKMFRSQDLDPRSPQTGPATKTTAMVR